MNGRLFDVIGLNNFEGYTFAQCTTYEKAQKAIKILEAEGFEGMFDIVQTEMLIDVVELYGELIEL